MPSGFLMPFSTMTFVALMLVKSSDALLSVAVMSVTSWPLVPALVASDRLAGRVGQRADVGPVGVPGDDEVELGVEPSHDVDERPGEVGAARRVDRRRRRGLGAALVDEQHDRLDALACSSSAYLLAVSTSSRKFDGR